jgi:hypothetical protein
MRNEIGSAAPLEELSFGAQIRILGIWFSGLIGSAILFAILGRAVYRLDGSYGDDGGFLGMLAGLALFTCARPWARERF